MAIGSAMERGRTFVSMTNTASRCSRRPKGERARTGCWIHQFHRHRAKPPSITLNAPLLLRARPRHDYQYWVEVLDVGVQLRQQPLACIHTQLETLDAFAIYCQ